MSSVQSLILRIAVNYPSAAIGPFPRCIFGWHCLGWQHHAPEIFDRLSHRIMKVAQRLKMPRLLSGKRFLYTLECQGKPNSLKSGFLVQGTAVPKECKSVNAQTKNQSRQPISNACPGEGSRHTGTLRQRANWTHQERCGSAAQSHRFGDLSNVGVS